MITNLALGGRWQADHNGHYHAKTRDNNGTTLRGDMALTERGAAKIEVKHKKNAGPWFNVKMSSYQYRKSHCEDKTAVRSSYLHNGISYGGKMSSLYWTNPQFFC